LNIYRLIRKDIQLRRGLGKLILSTLSFYGIITLIFGLFIYVNVYIFGNVTDPNLTPEQTASIGGALSGILVLPATIIYFLVTGFYFRNYSYLSMMIIGAIAAILIVVGFLLLSLVIGEPPTINPLIALAIAILLPPTLASVLTHALARHFTRKE
jgi:hypothetical protein